jgi:hypothetical protein
VDTFLGLVEDSDLSMWIRGDSMLAFPTIITLHTICMGLLASASAVIAASSVWRPARMRRCASSLSLARRSQIEWAYSFAAGCSRGSGHLLFTDQLDALPAI